MDDLVQWLTAQLDTDKRIARAVEDRSAPWDGQWVADGDDALRTVNGHVLFYGHNGPLKPGLAAHVAEHDPARVLREIDAKRQLVERYERAMENRRAHPDDLASAGALLALHGAVKLLALPYADRPGYREEWRP